MYKETIYINMGHTDAAGVIFHGRLFEINQMIYENLLRSKGSSFQSLLKEKNYLTPVVQCQANFKKTVTVGTQLEVSLTLDFIKNTSFAIYYSYVDPLRTLEVMTSNVTMVCIDRIHVQPRKCPQELVDFLKSI